MQRAMPTSVGTWLGSFAQGWKDAAKVLDGAIPGKKWRPPNFSHENAMVCLEDCLVILGSGGIS